MLRRSVISQKKVVLSFAVLTVVAMRLADVLDVIPFSLVDM